MEISPVEIVATAVHRDGTTEDFTVIMDSNVWAFIERYGGHIVFNRSIRKYARIRWPDGKHDDVHVFVWYWKSGEPIPKGFVVHHRNENKLDNRFENLQLEPRAAHSHHHQQVRDWKRRKFAPRETFKLGNLWRPHHPGPVTSPLLTELPKPPGPPRPVSAKYELLHALTRRLAEMLPALIQQVPQVRFENKVLGPEWFAFETYRTRIRPPKMLSNGEKALVLLLVRLSFDAAAVAHELDVDVTLVKVLAEREAVQVAVYEAARHQPVTLYTRPVKPEPKHSSRLPPARRAPVLMAQVTPPLGIPPPSTREPDRQPSLRKLVSANGFRLTYENAFTIQKAFVQLEDVADRLDGEPLARFMDGKEAPIGSPLINTRVAFLRREAAARRTNVTNLLMASARCLGAEAARLVHVPPAQLVGYPDAPKAMKKE